MKDELILELKDEIDVRFKSYKDLQLLFDENGEWGVMTKKVFWDIWIQNWIPITDIDIEFFAAHYLNKADK